MKVITTIIGTTIVVLFAIQNFDHVPIFFFGSKPVLIRMFFVMICCGVIGWFICYLTITTREENLKRRYRTLVNQYKKLHAQKTSADDDYV